VAVAKHGNRAITSRSGSAQVLEALGVNLGVTGGTQTRCLDEAGICFCFAPQHHPAMKHVMPVRLELGFRTIFNLLGPLTNPAGAQRQLIGVPSTELADTIAQVLRELEAEHVMLVHSRLPDGTPLGELTTFGPTSVSELHNGMIKSYQVDPSNLGLSFGVPDAVTVDSPQQSADMIRKVLSGEHGPARDIVALNAAAALKIAGLVDSLNNGLDLAREVIDSGSAQQTLDRLVHITQEDKR
jgi:anthranilate phosphoribosyltransferase